MRFDVKKALPALVLALWMPSLSPVAKASTETSRSSLLELPGCVEGLGCFEFLWPQNENEPGGAKLGLQAGPREEVRVKTPLGTMTGTSFPLLLPSGEQVAEARVYELPVSPGFRAFVVETTLKKSLARPAGEFAKTHFAFPAFTPADAFTRVLNFKEEAFAPPSREPVASTGPKILFSEDLDTVVFSALDRFLVAIASPTGRGWHCGIEGLVKEIPAGYTHQVIFVQGRGLKKTFLAWGDLVRGWHHHERQDPYRDVGLSYLGYWTDNGGYYYYNTEPGMNYHQTLIAVKKDADQRNIPFGYFQIDSWWYPKARSGGLISAFRGGALLWEPIPEYFPEGLPAFQKELGLPLIAHNRWYDRDSPYCERYQCVYGEEKGKRPALPIEPEFWDEIMDNAVRYGVAVYEQDWLITQMNLIPWLREGLYNAENWFDAMARAAAARGLTMQLCMASPGFFLQQMKHPNITQVRTSGDYIAGLPKTLFWPPFHTTSMLAYATGLWPFKDNFQSSSGQRLIRNERWPFEEALISILSAGLVGPSDKIGAADRELLMRTCREDGLLLKPDLPAMPLDMMFLHQKRPWLVTTKSSHSIGETIYLAAFNLWPLKLREPFVTFAELGLSGKEYLVYDWRKKEVILDAERIDFGKMPKNDACYYVLCPMLGPGLAMLGETGKFITMSRKRFPRVELEKGRLSIDVEGVPGEEVKVSFYVSCEKRKDLLGCVLARKQGVKEGVVSLKVTIPESGKETITFQ